jgi:predicted acetyltransferase
MAIVASVKPNASRRFRVMNCLLTTSCSCCTRARKPCAVRGSGWSGRETMMAALYPQSLPVHRPARPVTLAGLAAQRLNQRLKKWSFGLRRCSKTGMTEAFPIRPVTPDEFDDFLLMDQHAFGGSPGTPEDRAQTLTRFEFDRSLGAYDGNQLVGGTAIFSFRMRVPGAELPAAGVSWVSVLPTHRRRGILRSLMRQQLADIRDRGEPLAVLWAAEAVIYGRYGYGQASWTHAYTVHRGEGALAADAPVDPALRLRITEIEPVRAELGKVYEAVFETRPGFFRRNDTWWDRYLSDPPAQRHGQSPLRCVLAEDDAGPRGYSLYSAQGGWDDDTFLPEGSITVRELIATDPAANAALWGDLLSRDLTTEWHIRRRPVDDPIQFQLADPRRLRPKVSDALWARITDLPAALTQRRYACPVNVVLDVRDRVLPANAGRWRLQADETGQASCEPVDADAELSLDIADLGAAYLGGTRLGALAAAGRVEQLRAGALGQLSAAMAWDPAPWCPVIF